MISYIYTLSIATVLLALSLTYSPFILILQVSKLGGSGLETGWRNQNRSYLLYFLTSSILLYLHKMDHQEFFHFSACEHGFLLTALFAT